MSAEPPAAARVFDFIQSATASGSKVPVGITAREKERHKDPVQEVASKEPGVGSCCPLRRTGGLRVPPPVKAMDRVRVRLRR